jgi:hypothetical protein
MPQHASYPSISLASDSLLLHKVALQVKERDSLKGARFLDSLRHSRTLNWDGVISELGAGGKDTMQRTSPSVFTGHRLGAASTERPALQHTNSDWMLGVLLLVLTLLGAMRQLNNKRLMSYVSAFFMTRFAGQLQREEYAVSNRTSIALLLCFVLVLSLFIFQVFGYFGVVFPCPPLLLYLYICGSVTLVYAGKLLAVRILAGIFNVENEAAEYIFYILLVNQALGMLLLPLVIILAFTHLAHPEVPIYTGLVLIGILFIYRTLRAIGVGVSRLRISGLYLFLYLCTLEFLPIPFAIKYLGLV